MIYNVSISAPALDDVAEIFHYIAVVLNEPSAAARVKDAILEAVDTLSEFPLRNPISQDEPYKSKGIRKYLVKNYYVFYEMNESDVTILRILYNRRDWQNIL